MSKLRAAVVQTAPVFGDVRANVEQALDLIPAGCDLAVLPELFSTGYQFRSRAEAAELAEALPGGPTAARLIEFAAAKGVAIVAGIAETGKDCLYNSCLLARPDGGVAVYRKSHLFWEEKLCFAPGDTGFAVHDAAAARVGMMICFDWIFPESARTLAMAGAEIICHPSNLVLPHCPDAMITRCIENRVFAITANRVGVENRTGRRLRFIGLSRIVSPRGEILAGLDETETGAAVAEIDTAETDKSITPLNDLWEDRRPELYGI